MRLAPALCALALTGCGSAPEPESPLAGADPAVTAALSEPLMTDPDLQARANFDTRKPGDDPYRALLPRNQPSPLRGDRVPTVAARLASALDGAIFSGCSRNLRYSYGYAAALPVALALPQGAAVVEAAGSDAPACRLRLVAFDADARIAERLRTLPGFAVTASEVDGMTTLTGRAGPTAFVAIVYPAAGGKAQVDLAVR